MEQFPPVPPAQPQTEPASPSNSTVAGVWEEGGGWESRMGNNDIINYPQPLPVSPARSSSVENGPFLPTRSSFWIPSAKLGLAQCPLQMPLQVKVTILYLLLESKGGQILTIPGSLRDPVGTSQWQKAQCAIQSTPHSPKTWETITFQGSLAVASLGDDGARKGNFQAFGDTDFSLNKRF